MARIGDRHQGTRRALIRGAAGTAAIIAFPMLNFGSLRAWADGPREYSTRAIDLVGRSLVIDMLGVLKIDFRPEAFGPFPESYALTAAGDVRIVPTPGHTPGHVSVVLAEDGGSVFFAGDASYAEDQMRRGVVDGVAPDPAQAQQTLDRIRRFTEQEEVVYLPAHDPGAAGRLAARSR